MYCPLYYVLLFSQGELGWSPHNAKVGQEVDAQRQNGDDDNEEEDKDEDENENNEDTGCKGSNQVYSTIPIIIIFSLHFLSLTRPNPFLVLFIYFIMFPHDNFPTPLISHQFLCALPSSIIFPVHHIPLM